MLDILARQRLAFFAELPAPLAIRRDRLRRAIALIEQNGDALCAAIAQDHEHHDLTSAQQTEIAPALAALRHALRHVSSWMRPIYDQGLWGRLTRGGDYVQHQPAGVVGLAAPARLAVHQTMNLLASVFAAGNRAMVRFDDATPALRHLFAELAPQYFNAEELHITGDSDALTFAALPFDLFATSDADADVQNVAPAALTIERSGKSPVILGRSADFDGAAEQVIAAKLVKSGHIPLTPDYLLVPEEQQEAIASSLWRSAMALHPRMARDTEVDLPLSDAKLARFHRLIENARARGEILTVDRPGHAGVQHMSLHIIRHASEDMAVMQEEICGPILPLFGYRHIDDAIAAIHRHPTPFAIYHFGRDAAERRHIVSRTISSAIALDGSAQAAIPPVSIGLKPSHTHGEAGFRSFSRARHVYHRPLIESVRIPGLPSGGPATIGSH